MHGPAIQAVEIPRRAVQVDAKSPDQCKEVQALAFGFVAGQIRIGYISKPRHAMVSPALDASQQVHEEQPDAGKSKFLAGSLLYIENTAGERREPLLSVRQAAALLGLCTATVYEYCASGKLHHVRVASAIRITSSALEEFVSPPRDQGRPPVLALPPARGPDAMPDLRESRPATGEHSEHSNKPDEDAWYKPE
jgi:excisionase family DNA binding protein